VRSRYTLDESAGLPALAAPLTLAAALLFFFDPAATWWFPSCPLRTVTGLLCPFCGSLRAVHALLHGAPGLALELNPLVTVGGAAGLGALVLDAACPSHPSQCERLIGFCFSLRGAALVGGFGVLRNVAEAFGWMAG
jgi:hypothetical protein